MRKRITNAEEAKSGEKRFFDLIEVPKPERPRLYDRATSESSDFVLLLSYYERNLRGRLRAMLVNSQIDEEEVYAETAEILFSLVHLHFGGSVKDLHKDGKLPNIPKQFEIRRDVGFARTFMALASTRNGVAGKHIRDSNRHANKHVEIDTLSEAQVAFAAAAASENEQIEDIVLAVQALKSLTPRERFVFRLYYAEILVRHDEGVADIAFQCGFQSRDSRSIERRARNAGIDIRPATALNISEISVLLDTSTKTVSRALRTASKKIRIACA